MGCLGKVLFFPDKEEVFIVPFHEIFFTGVFFNSGRVRFQLFQLSFGGTDFILIELTALLQLFKFLRMPDISAKKVSFIKKQHPDYKDSIERANEEFANLPGDQFLKDHEE